jgi:hypothetical protein
MIPVNLPPTTVVAVAPAGDSRTVEELCREAGIACRVTGPSTKRTINLRYSKTVKACREPGLAGTVTLGLPETVPHKRAVLALGVLAYSVFDYVARESLRGLPESRPSAPRGRPRKPQPLTGAERQKNWRSRNSRRAA